MCEAAAYARSGSLHSRGQASLTLSCGHSACSRLQEPRRFVDDLAAIATSISDLCTGQVEIDVLTGETQVPLKQPRQCFCFEVVGAMVCSGFSGLWDCGV